MTTQASPAQYPLTTAAQLDIGQREAEGASRLVGWEPGDDDDDVMDARLAECRARDEAARG